MFENLARISQLIVAVVAMLTLWHSIQASREVTATSREIVESSVAISDSMRAMAIPVTKFVSFGWGVVDKKLDCENPPGGLAIEYGNTSLVPVQIRRASAVVKFGRRKISDSIEVKGKDTDKIVLAPGETTRKEFDDNDFFGKHLSTPKLDPESGPNLNFLLEVEYSSIGSTDYFRYKGEFEIYWDCKNPGIRRYRRISDSIDPMQ